MCRPKSKIGNKGNIPTPQTMLLPTNLHIKIDQIIEGQSYENTDFFNFEKKCNNQRLDVL